MLAGALLVALPVWVIPRLRGSRLKHLTPLVGLAAVLSVTIEGTRWQLYPAYVLATALLAIWACDAVGLLGSDRRRVPRLLRGIASGLGVFGLLIAVLLPVALPVFRFDEPTGRYAVGSATYHWVDDARPELFTPAPDDRRELMARVWYPVDREQAATTSARAPYLRAAEHVTGPLARASGFPEFLFEHFAQVDSNAVPGAPMSEARTDYPVLLFLTGVNGFAESNTFQVQELVSHGFVVVALDQPGVSAATRLPDGRTITIPQRKRMNALIGQSLRPNRSVPSLHGQPLPEGIVGYFAEDVSFAIDRLTALNRNDPDRLLTERLDLDRLGTFGVSLGGMTGAQACANDDRLRACLIMDVELTRDTLDSGLQQPSMFVTRPGDTMRTERRRLGGWSEDEIASTLGRMRSAFANSPADSYLVSITGMFHLDFTDAPRWSPLTSRLGMTGPIDGDRGFTLVNQYSRAFFEHHLNGRPAPLLTGDTEHFPEVHFKRSVGR